MSFDELLVSLSVRCEELGGSPNAGSILDAIHYCLRGFNETEDWRMQVLAASTALNANDGPITYIQAQTALCLKPLSPCLAMPKNIEGQWLLHVQDGLNCTARGSQSEGGIYSGGKEFTLQSILHFHQLLRSSVNFKQIFYFRLQDDEAGECLGALRELLQLSCA